MGLLSLFSSGVQSQLINIPDTIAQRVDPLADENVVGNEPEYDVVIIGGGTAGCAIAARLSEDKNVRVLLLEAGGSSRDNIDCIIPALFTRTLHTELDWRLWTEPQVGAAGAKKHWPRAKMLGGCSAINAMMFHVCAPSDYDEWAHSLNGQEGASSWAHGEFVKYFRKFEHFVPHPKYSSVDTSVRGTDGPVEVGYFGYLHDTSSKWMDTCVKLGIPHSPDVNAPTGTLGVTKIMTYIDSHGKRVTTETAYLTPTVLKRPNLKVSINSNATRIIFETNGNKKKAVGVEFVRQKGGTRYRVRAKQEIVLSAGAIHSPHILMLSGVGPEKHLAEHNIPLVHDLPGVGQNMQDHVAVAMNLRVKSGHSLSYLKAGLNPTLSLDTLKAIVSLARWKLFGTGPMTTNPAEVAAFIRSDDTRLYPSDEYNIKDMTSGPNAPDLETTMLTVGFAEHGHGKLPPGDIISSITVLLRPQSSGTITLKSGDPHDAPSIDPKYLSAQNDVACLVRGLKHTIRMTQTEPLASVLVHDDDPALDHNLYRLSDAELEDYVRKRVETLYHPVATCRMAKLEDNGVVDSTLRVYGIENLRVADASIFTHIPAGHTTAPSIAVGEKAADIIKQSLVSA